MALHFSREEFAARLDRTLAAMEDKGLDALLAFAPETHYWLTGFDTFGYCFFQCLVVRADGQMTLLTRSADLRQAQQTSLISDIRIWEDRDGANPAEDLADLLVSLGLLGKRVGVEIDTHGLTHRNGKRLEAALEGRFDMLDASLLVPPLRLVKSAAEIACVARAAELADDAFDAALGVIGPGADEGHVLAAMQGAVFAGGGDYPGNPFIIGSGRDALLCRYKSGRRVLEPQDQITLEWAGVHRQYHAAMMWTVPVGRASDRHKRLFEVSRDALMACEGALKPGNTMGDVFAAHAETFDRAGLSQHRLNACGYAMGARYAPSWMDYPMFYRDNPAILAPDMTFFLHMICMDSESGTAMTLGRSYRVTQAGNTCLSRRPLELVVR